MRRVWRLEAMTVLRFVAVLELATVVYARTVGADLNRNWPIGGHLFWLGIGLFLVWRISRGGAAARWTLIALTAVPILLTVTTVVSPGWYFAGLLAIEAMKLALLFSPAVRRHVHTGAWTRRSGSAYGVIVRPTLLLRRRDGAF